ncbi:unnamed protein product [Caenorhabditis bovis]|uniref:Tyrosine-protein kinase n=1 Tax=Caenorhabditis bovis TaxID=2654633 RepID=A0A8S1EQT6_9PELO|nr:unnamed protein product [Caenorhabditis bovis]
MISPKLRAHLYASGLFVVTVTAAYFTYKGAMVIKKPASELALIDLPQDVRDCEYYHGRIPRVEAELSLRVNGEFLLRKADAPNGIYLVLSVRMNDGFLHFPISQEKDGKFYFEPNFKEATITELVAFHKNSETPITKVSKAVITKRVVRPVWLVKHECLALVKKLGAGAFGEVFLAQMEDPTSPSMLDCAVKSMRQEASTEARLRFMKEARMMRKSYQHKHVVMIFGIAVHYQPLLIIMELCPNGDLVSYLRKNKGNVHPYEKLKFSLEAADGLSYLEKLGCIHRDVAARNCLLSAKNEIKISDFGMADEKILVVDTTLDKMPIKWLAPETMQEKIYSLKSDIWAFGVMLWEIYSDGEEPYPGLTPVQTRAKIVVQDYRMKMPEGTPKEVIEVVEICWNKNPEKRGEQNHPAANISLLNTSGTKLSFNTLSGNTTTATSTMI